MILMINIVQNIFACIPKGCDVKWSTTQMGIFLDKILFRNICNIIVLQRIAPPPFIECWRKAFTKLEQVTIHQLQQYWSSIESRLTQMLFHNPHPTPRIALSLPPYLCDLFTPQCTLIYCVSVRVWCSPFFALIYFEKEKNDTLT